MSKDLPWIKRIQKLPGLEKNELAKKIRLQSLKLFKDMLMFFFVEVPYDVVQKDVDDFISSFKYHLLKENCLIGRYYVWNILYNSFFKNDKILNKAIERMGGTPSPEKNENIKAEAKKIYSDLVDKIYLSNFRNV